MPEKKVSAEVRQSVGFRTECRAGHHQVIVDQPASAGGTDAGPTPLELQLMALGACLAAIARIVASQRRIHLRGVTVALQGELDTDVLLGKRTDQRVGFQAIDVEMSVDADLSAEDKAAFVREVEQRCPISDNLQNSTPVRVALKP